ncbi:hypothetical protein L249_2478 [Ophiocordyceps polyrhachis-furcata BCC 54312]|uniref:Protein kinase domain-containing protein n=1 Tax=Ophiocordyceps polyrhachis-furcata BCC 54312 TaxID=1330021 RepID=A0A367LPX3_9HYPO|nr:hypothetical protein L249_2478 [Ophiocordyceps polyrhachis-furcata BCC 54312]
MEGFYLELAYRGACLCIKALRNGLHYAKDAERLVLKLEMERFRLKIWGENSGLTPPGGGPASLSTRLTSISDVLARYLDGISSLLKDADVLRDRYGLTETKAQPTSSARVKGLLDKMQRSMLPSRTDQGGDEDEEEEGDVDDEAIGGLDLERKTAPSSGGFRRFRWAVRDLGKFEGLIDDLAGRISQLVQLLSESQQLKTQEDNERVNIVLVDSVDNQQTLDFLLEAVRTAPRTSPTRFRVESKAISADLAWTCVPYASRSSPQPSLSDFLLPDGYPSMKRFVTRKVKDEEDVVYLLERKDFDPDIGHDDKERLVSRLQRLVMLLSKPKTAAFRTPLAEGCINDDSGFCWWMVFRLPPPPPPPPPKKSVEPTPLSLSSLLQPKSKFRPRLEERYELASRLCTTLFELYSSSWLHKGIRSDNVLFSGSSDDDDDVLKSMLLCGFDFSRQESEWSTIDRSRSSADVAAALYRHPRYQGEAAEGYKMQYDVYSLGLVLVEIALWMPLSSFLDAKPVVGGKSSNDGPKLSPDMSVFYEPHATLLKKRVTGRVESEFRFRVGTTYYETTKFCLEFADRTMASEGDNMAPHPSLEFYNAVVVPLSRLARHEGLGGI